MIIRSIKTTAALHLLMQGSRGMSVDNQLIQRSIFKAKKERNREPRKYSHE
jgi:hypothetical protein